ncbi:MULTISPECIES: serine/threonine-protein kinase [Actinomadura]|uniref:non-specific serine/threonine protein kinase n=1 Tax=Actinomadura yumaensis TaxID=111807 RepID=A0ABW2CDC7_9ACTN|nr:serine/threonine-protein kinase [Actinomadura sp. J1-007]MWK35786.1 protein kinase [Actinomadura sp. J1-007]
MARTVVNGWTVPGFTHERELGGGGSGRVVLAVDDMTRTKVSIKYLDSRLDADEAFLSRFRSVSRRLSQLEDPNVVDFYDFVETPQGTAIVMEHVEGVNLRRMLAAQGPTGPLAALSVLGGVLLGLAAAHERDVVHTAVRPANVMIDNDGNARLTDFGLAPAGTEAQAGPPYAAPELWDGAIASLATDLYAATAIFFECLTGRPPFTGRNLAKAHRETPIPVEEVPGPLRDLVASGLAKEPEKRPASAADFLGALEEAAVAAYGGSWEAQGRGRLAELAAQTAAQPEPAPPRGRAAAAVSAPPKGGGRGKWAAVAVAAAVVVGGGAVAAMTMVKDDEAKPEPSPAQSTSPQPVAPANQEAARLVERINQATARTPSASFGFRRSGCCNAGTNARGALGLVRTGPASYSMTVTGTGEVRRPARTVLVGDTAYLRAGKKWRPAPASGRGYPALAAQVRSGSSVQNVTSLLGASTVLRKTGAVWRGDAPLAALSQAAGVGPLYAEIARATGAQQVGFALRLDRADRPVRLWLKAQGPAKRAQIVSATYSGWARKAPIAAPR